MRIKLKRINDKLAFQSENEESSWVKIDANPAVGGEGLGMRPMELLLSALVSCTSIDVLLILKKMRLDLSFYEVEVRAKRKDSVPAVFEKIHLLFQIGKDDPKEQVEKAVKLSLEKYCSVAASLDKDISLSWEVTSKADN